MAGEYEHWQKIKPDIRALGCGLQFGGAENDLVATRLQSSNTHFSVAPGRGVVVVVVESWHAARAILIA
jgi:hypothetical protein